MVINKTNYEVGDPFSILQSNQNQENERIDKFSELHNSILNISIEERSNVIVAQKIF